MKLQNGCLMGSLLLGMVAKLQAGAVCAESPVVAVETRAMGVCIESSVIQVDTRTQLDLWMADNTLVGADALSLARPFGDGVTNLLKYAFNLNGAGADGHILEPLGSSGLPYADLGTERLVLIALRRKDDPGLAYKAHFSKNLLEWTSVEVPVQIVPIDAVWDRITFESPSLPMDSGRWFGRIEVLYTPP